MRRLVRVGGVVAALLLALPLTGQGEAGIPVGSRGPVVSVNDLEGKAVDLGQWVGKKPVLIEFWPPGAPTARNCSPGSLRRTASSGTGWSSWG